MQILAAILTLLSLALALVIGVRLARRAREPLAPEAALAVYFLCTGFVGAGLNISLYMGWADPALALPDRVAAPLLGLSTALASLGALGLYTFTWRAFHPASAAVRRGVVGAGVLLAAAWGLQAATEGFAIVVLPGPAYWLSLALRLLPLAWMAPAPSREAAAARRRLRVGLSEPLVANRLGLWGLWAAATLALGLSDPAARIAYVAASGDTVRWIPEVGQPIVHVTVLFTSSGMALAVTALFLTFFPTAGYRRWVEARAARAGAGSAQG